MIEKNDRTITLTFNEDLYLPSAESLPGAVANAFKVTAEDTTIAVSAVKRIERSRRRLVLVLENVPIYAGDSVSLTYNEATAGNEALVDKGANRLESFANFDVTNNSSLDPKPSPPTGLTATGKDGRIDLSWTAPENSGAGPVTGYKVEVSESGTGGWETLVESQTETTYSHTGLGLEHRHGTTA